MLFRSPISGLLLPSWRFRLRQGPWPISSTLRSASNEPVESTSPDELLDLISEPDAFLRVVAVVAVVEIELVGVVLPGVCAHPLWPRELLPNLHQYLGLRGIEGGVVAKSFRWRTPPNPTIRTSLPAYSGWSMGTLVPRRGSRMRLSFSRPFFDCGLTRVPRLLLSRGLLILHFESFFCSGVPFSSSQ